MAFADDIDFALSAHYQIEMLRDLKNENQPYGVGFTIVSSFGLTLRG